MDDRLTFFENPFVKGDVVILPEGTCLMLPGYDEHDVIEGAMSVEIISSKYWASQGEIEYIDEEDRVIFVLLDQYILEANHQPLKIRAKREG